MAFSALLSEKLGSLPYFSLLPARLLLPRQAVEPFLGEANSQIVTFGHLLLKKLAHCLILPCSKSHLCTTPHPHRASVRSKQLSVRALVSRVEHVCKV